MAALTAERVRLLLDYDPETGRLTRKSGRGGCAKGSLAGSVDAETGYVKVYVDGRNYLAHRVIWLHVTGAWPPRLDHENLKRADNRWDNLRVATNGENMMNGGLRADNTSASRGVYWHAGARKWAAQIVALGVHHYLGLFADFDSALAARSAAARLHHGAFARVD